MNSILDQTIPSEDTPKKEWSSFQHDIYDAIEDTNDSLLIEAVAGSGKSTTLTHAISLALGSNLALAFNKAIADELRAKVGSAGEVKTLNALGHRQIMINRPKAQLDSDKLKKITKRLLSYEDNGDWGYSVMRAVGLAKNNAVGIDGPIDVGEMSDIIDNYLDVPADKLNDVARWATSVMTASLAETDTFDFDDQLYVPILEKWRYPHYDNVFVDEAQDLSPIQHLMLQSMDDARIIAVGDRHQAIYGFRGACHTSMDLLKDRFHMKELPLSITYRCPQSVVTLAQRYVPHIQPRQGAPHGTVQYRQDLIDESSGLQHYADPRLFTNQLVLARTNAPLFKAILRHIRAKDPCRVLSNFLDSFASFVRQLGKNQRGGWEAMSSSKALEKLDNWYQRECEEAEGRRGKLAYLRDKYDTVKMLLEEYATVGETVEMVRRLSKSNTGPTFSTIHKAKGLEAPHVYILRPDLMPSPWASSEEELLQEDNLSYVAITRSQDSLTFGISEWNK